MINAIELSPHAEGTAYLAVTGYKLNDFKPYIYKTTNHGARWKRIDRGLPDGAYVRRFIPELKEVPKAYIHRPWELGPLELMGMGLQLGKDYPEPMVAHAEGRARALDAFKQFQAHR